MTRIKSEYILYIHPHCRVCKKQLKDLGIGMSHRNVRNCLSGRYPHITAYPTWHNTRTGRMVEGYIGPTMLSKKLDKRNSRRMSLRRVRFGTYGDQALIDCNGNRGTNNTAPSTIPQLWDAYKTKFGSAPLPRPFGPRDNATMGGPHYAGSSLPPLPLDLYKLGQFGRNRKNSRKNSRKQFGSTPGTKQWWGTGTVRPEGPIQFYEGPPGTPLDPNDSINVPMQFSNNRMNRFGWNLANISGPNNVAYQPNIPMYYGGANTTNFLFGSPYRPEQCPTTKVQPDPYTRDGWLSSGPGLVGASSAVNGARTLVHRGLGFGNAAGPEILVNTLPARLTYGTYDASYANFGKRSYRKKPYHAKVTLGPSGRVSVKKKKILPQGNGHLHTRRSTRSLRLSKMGL